VSIAVTRSLRSLRSSEVIELRVPAEPAPSAVPFGRQPTGPATPARTSAGGIAIGEDIGGVSL
jgi:hypothetical protein